MGIRKIWNRWIEISEVIGNVVSKVFLTVLYFTIFVIPSAFLTYVSDRFGKVIEPESTSYYHTQSIKISDIDEAKEM